MHRGPAGAGALNTLLQQALAPAAEGTPERRHGARVFRPGGKVIQIRNNYDKGTVFNGTVGTITALSVTTSMNSTSCSTPMPSPCIGPRAASIRWWSCR